MDTNNNNLKERLVTNLSCLESFIDEIFYEKTKLRNKANEIRKEISQATTYQISCIYAKNQELLTHLDNIITEKENRLFLAEEKLKQTLGIYKEMLQYSSLDSLPQNDDTLIKKIDNLEISAESSKIISDHSLMDFQKRVSEIFKPNYKNENESDLLANYYHIDDGTFSENSRNRTQSSTSEFEIINDESSNTNKTPSSNSCTDLFKEYFEEVNNLPLNFWLKQNDLEIAKKGHENDNNSIKSIKEINSNEKINKKSQLSQNLKYEFENVIRNIHNSCNENWLIDNGKTAIKNSDSSHGAYNSKNKKKHCWSPYGDKGSKPSLKWSEWHRTSLNNVEGIENNFENVFNWKVNYGTENQWLKNNQT